MLKSDVAQYILREWAPANMARASQVCIQKMIVIFSSVQSYRSHCGYPGKTMAVDSTWRAGWSSQMDELFTLVENVLFDQLFDGALKEAVKRGQVPEEVMNDEMFHEAAERIKNLYDTTEEDENANDNDIDSEGDAIVDGTKKDGTCILLQSTTKASATISEDDEEGGNEIDNTPTAKKAFKKAVIRFVDSHITLIPDKGGADKVLAEKMAKTAACKYSVRDEGLAGKGVVLLVVDPSNGAESTAHPHLRKPPCNQEAVLRCVTVGLMARSLCIEGAASTERIMEHDCWALFEGGRAIESMLLKGFKGADGKTLKKSKFVLTINIDEESLINNIGRSTQMGSITCTDRCILTTLDDLSLPRRNRTNYKGATFFNFYVFNALQQ